MIDGAVLIIAHSNSYQGFIQDFLPGGEIGLGVTAQSEAVIIYILMFSVHVVIKFGGGGNMSEGEYLL